MRDDRLGDFLTEHAATPRICVERGFFRNKDCAWRGLRRLIRKGKIRFCGTVLMNRNGRPEHVVTKGWIAEANQLRHEVLITGLDAVIGPIRRRNLDPKVRPDGLVPIGKAEIPLELHTGTMTYAETVEKRFKMYPDRFVLWVVHQDTVKQEETLIEGLRQRAGGMPKAMFAPYSALMAHGRDCLVVDVNGTRFCPWKPPAQKGG